MKALIIDRKTRKVLNVVEVSGPEILDVIRVGDCIKVMQADIAQESDIILVGDDVGAMLDAVAQKGAGDAQPEPAFMRVLRALGIKG